MEVLKRTCVWPSNHEMCQKLTTNFCTLSLLAPEQKYKSTVRSTYSSYTFDSHIQYVTYWQEIGLCFDWMSILSILSQSFVQTSKNLILLISFRPRSFYYNMVILQLMTYCMGLGLKTFTVLIPVWLIFIFCNAESVVINMLFEWLFKADTGHPEESYRLNWPCLIWDAKNMKE